MVNIDSVPDLPGCYLYKDKEGTIIYVGKAKSLIKRVRSYFSLSKKDPKTELLVSDIASLDYIVTTTEVEALLLENNLIKKYRPKYNIDLKDSTYYAYILVTDERYPRLLVARDKTKAGKYYGPFVNAEARDNILKALKKTFRLRTCRKFKSRPCLRHHIHLCDAPCSGAISHEEYSKRIKHAERFLQGGVKDLIDDLNAEMQYHSKAQHYEKAMLLRDQISSLTMLYQRQSVERDTSHDEDIINYVRDGKMVHLMVFHAKKGILSDKDVFSFEHAKGIVDEFVKLYYSDSTVPREIILPSPLEDPSIAQYLHSLRGGQVKLTVPKRGKKVELLTIVAANLEARFLVQKQMVKELKTALGLPRLPKSIECFDISHTSGTFTVGSMVQFKNGAANKSEYRRFKIRSVEGVDDYMSIGEVVYRRYFRLMREKKPLPDLVVIDGGKGQLSAAVQSLSRAGAHVPAISLAKREEEIFVPYKNEPVVLSAESKALKLLVQIRDEAHRFAISYHKLLRSKGLVNGD